MSLIRSLIERGLSQTDAEHYAALIESFSARQAELMAQLEAAGLRVSADVTLRVADEPPLSDAAFVARVRELLRPYGVGDESPAALLEVLRRLLARPEGS